MSIENVVYHFVCICPFCGVVMHDDVPIPSDGSKARAYCNKCGKHVIEFHVKKKGEQT